MTLDPSASADWLPIQRPSAWRPSTVGTAADYSLRLDAAMVDEIARLASDPRDGDRPVDLARRDRELQSFLPLLEAAERELMTGRAFVVLKGFPVQALDEASVTAFCAWLGHRVGRLLPQNQEGDLIYTVENHHRRDGGALFTSKTDLEITWHTDASYLPAVPDYVGLLVMRVAESGGAAKLVSAHTLYNTMLAEQPHHLQRLFQPFYYSYQSKTTKPGERPVAQMPILSWRDGVVTIRYNRQRLERGYELAEQDIPDDVVDSVECFEDLLERDDLRLDLELEPGDMYIIHNRRTIHARTAFTDPVAGGGRLLYRLWLDRGADREAG